MHLRENEMEADLLPEEEYLMRDQTNLTEMAAVNIDTEDEPYPLSNDGDPSDYQSSRLNYGPASSGLSGPTIRTLNFRSFSEMKLDIAKKQFALSKQTKTLQRK